MKIRTRTKVDDVVDFLVLLLMVALAVVSIGGVIRVLVVLGRVLGRAPLGTIWTIVP